MSANTGATSPSAFVVSSSRRIHLRPSVPAVSTPFRVAIGEVRTSTLSVFDSVPGATEMSDPRVDSHADAPFFFKKVVSPRIMT